MGSPQGYESVDVVVFVVARVATSVVDGVAPVATNTAVVRVIADIS